MKEPAHPVMALGKVRHVGDPVAFVVAETLQQAQPASEKVIVDYELYQHRPELPVAGWCCANTPACS